MSSYQMSKAVRYFDYMLSMINLNRFIGYGIVLDNLDMKFSDTETQPT